MSRRVALCGLELALMLVGAPAALCHAPPATFAPLVIERQATLPSGMTGDNFVFEDAHAQRREAFMLPNDRQDAFGTWGGCLHRLVYEHRGERRVCAAQNPNHPGFGYTVNHYPTSFTSSRFVRGSYSDNFVGRHHAIRRYTWLQTIDGHKVHTSIAWMVASGRNDLLWSVTYDLHDVPPDVLLADTRAPYGDIAWDGGNNSPVAGLGWGDRYLFRTTRAPVDVQTGWDYSERNETKVPYVFAFTDAPDAEMGIVQTESLTRHDAGGSDLWRSWGDKQPDGPLPPASSWPFQLNQYELPATLTSKRIAWGSNYGALGQRQASAYGDDRVISGWPLVSYSTRIVLGAHSAAPTPTLAREVALAQQSRFVAIAGAQVATRAPAGVARSDEAKLQTPGLDPVWYAWTAKWNASATQASVELSVAQHGVLGSPLIIFNNYEATCEPRVLRDGNELVADSQVLMSVDALAHKLYVTVVGPWRASHRLDFVLR